MKILLAEDEHELSRALVAVLEHNEYEVTAVFNGEEAVEAAKASTYDCFIFDIMMPVKDGISALKEIRAAGDITPALFLTAKSETNDKITVSRTACRLPLARPCGTGSLHRSRLSRCL